MLLEAFILLWITTLVFTTLSIIYPQRFFLLLIPFALWNVMAMACTQIYYIGFGSTNPIFYSIELGDPQHPTFLMWIFHGIGVIFLVYAVGTYFQMAAHDLRKIGERKTLDTIIGRPHG